MLTLIEESKFSKFEKVEQRKENDKVIIGKVYGKQKIKISIVTALEHYFFP